MQPDIVLTPAQQRAADGLLEGLAVGGILVLRGENGAGKTTIFESIHTAKGGVLISARELVSTLASQDPNAIEEAFLRVLEDAMYAHDLVLTDGLHLITDIVDRRDYARRHLLDAALTAILAEARAAHKTLAFATRGNAPWPIQLRAFTWEIEEFGAADYEAICRARFPGSVLDYGAIHRFAPGLNAHQLRNASLWLGRTARLDTAAFIAYLREPPFGRQCGNRRSAACGSQHRAAL